jgi:hypothetical protein
MPDDYYVSQYSGEEIDERLTAAHNAVRYDAAQTLTDEQKAQARGNINAAPDGFGYGGALDTVSGATDEVFLAAVESKLATMPNTGAMQINWGSYPALDGLSRVGTLAKHGDQYASLTGYSYGGTAITRCKNAGVWGAWEWVNPPMMLGVEYRTTERYLGKPVYVKAVDCGNLPAPGSTKNVSHGVSGCLPIMVTAQMSNSNTIPWLGKFTVGADNTNIVLYSPADASDFSGLTAMAILKYIKTTD